MSVRILVGDCLERLRTLPEESVHCVVTSPPYWGLRDYGVEGAIGLERTLQEHIDALVRVFREVRRVLRSDGTLWLNYGDAYRAKQLLMMPARVALALQADGWWLRSEIVWHKPNPMPESVTDRPTRAHEYVFLLTKSARYFYDADAIREPYSPTTFDRSKYLQGDVCDTHGQHKPGNERLAAKDPKQKIRSPNSAGRNRRTVWDITTKPYRAAHFATFPPKLVEPCIKAGCPVGGVVLDPFGGSGTVGLVASRLGRDAILIELNPEYAEMAERRIHEDAPMFADVEVGA